MFGVNGWEVILLALIAVFVLGPDRMPEYAAKLARGIRKLRVMAEGAKDQLRDQLGPEYEDINWRQYDPRQYDPRRIVREALLEPLDDAVAPIRDEISSVRSAARLRGEPEAAAGAAAAGAAAGVAVAARTSGDTGVPGAVPGDGPADLDEPTGHEPARRPEVGAHDAMARAWAGPQYFDAARPTPYDVEAT